jgi:hypothetical protein
MKPKIHLQINGLAFFKEITFQFFCFIVFSRVNSFKSFYVCILWHSLVKNYSALCFVYLSFMILFWALKTVLASCTEPLVTMVKGLVGSTPEWLQIHLSFWRHTQPLKLQTIDITSSRLGTFYDSSCWCILIKGRIFSCVRRFYERAVSNLVRPMQISLWV